MIAAPRLIPTIPPTPPLVRVTRKCVGFHVPDVPRNVSPIRAPLRSRAFTLLELLVATTIFSILLAALYATLFGGMQLRETAWSDFESNVERGHVSAIIRRDLTNIVVPAGILAGPILGETQTEGDARTDTVELFTATGAVTEGEPWGDIQKIEYFLTEPLDESDAEISGGISGGGYDFVRRVRRDLLATTVEEEDVPEPEWRLLHGVTALTLSYFDGEVWNDAWDSTTVENENPRAMRIRLEFTADADARPRPPLEIVCEVAQRPRPTPSTSGAGTTSGPPSAADPGSGGGSPSAAGATSAASAKGGAG